MAVKNYGADPATLHYAVTPSSANLLPIVPRAVYIQTSGVLEMADASNTFISYTVTAGQVVPFRPLRFGSNTTATIVAWY